MKTAIRRRLGDLYRLGVTISAATPMLAMLRLLAWQLPMMPEQEERFTLSMSRFRFQLLLLNCLHSVE